MKKNILISFLLLQLSIFAQNDSNWNFGIEFSTDVLSISNGKNVNFLYTKGDNEGYFFEFDENNYSFGLIAKYFINKKIAISSGILYSNKDFFGSYHHVIYNSEYFLEKKMQRFLTIPISVDYRILTEKFKPIIKGGVKNNIEIKNDLKEVSKGYFIEAFIGVSVNYEFSKQWNGEMGYNYQSSLSDLYKTDKFNFRTNSFYLQMNYTLE